MTQHPPHNIIWHVKVCQKLKTRSQPARLNEQLDAHRDTSSSQLLMWWSPERRDYSMAEPVLNAPYALNTVRDCPLVGSLKNNHVHCIFRTITQMWKCDKYRKSSAFLFSDSHTVPCSCCFMWLISVFWLCSSVFWVSNFAVCSEKNVKLSLSGSPHLSTCLLCPLVVFCFVSAPIPIPRFPDYV